MENENLEILVVEDNPEHRAEAQTLWDMVRAKGITLQVYTVEDMDSLTSALAERKYDGIISDIFYPDVKGQPEKENGISAIRLATEKGLPIVLCTSTYHHGARTEPVNKFCHEQDVPLIDAYLGENPNGVAAHKNWASAYYEILTGIGLHALGGANKVAREIFATKDVTPAKVQREATLQKVLASMSSFALDQDQLKKHAESRIHLAYDKVFYSH